MILKNIEELMKNSLRYYRKKAGFKTLEAFSEATGLSVSAIGNVETGTRNPGEDFLQEACRVLKITREELLSPIPGIASNASNPILEPVGRRIPLISWAKAGEAEYPEDVVDWDNFVETSVHDPKAIAVTIHGDSMEPVIKEGDIVILLCSEKPRTGDIVVAKMKNDGVICKLFHIAGPDGKTFRLTSYNSVYPNLDLTEDDFQWIYPVGESKRIFRH